MGRLSCASGLRTLSGYILGGEASGWPRTDLLRSICLPLLPSSSLQPVPIILSRSFCTCLTVRTPTLWGNRASAQSATTPESLTQSRGALSGLQGPIQRASFNPGDVSANFGSPQEALLDASSPSQEGRLAVQVPESAGTRNERSTASRRRRTRNTGDAASGRTSRECTGRRRGGYVRPESLEGRRVHMRCV